MKSLTLTLLLAAVLTAPLFAGAQETTTLRILVQNEEGSPVPRASLIVKTLKGKKQKVDETFQLRTSQQGSAPLPPLKQGFALIQVIAEGYQTYGERIELTEAEQTLVVTLKPPQDQFSVHKK